MSIHLPTTAWSPPGFRMEIVPPSLEYLLLLGVYLLLLLVLLADLLPALLRKRSFWLSALAFAGCWTALEIFGLAAGIWVYSAERLCGLTFLTVPLEEYIIFVLIHLATVGSWHLFGRRDELD